MFEREIDLLANLPRSGLVELWRNIFSADPPKGISQPLLFRTISYEMQVKRYGGLKPATARRLRKIATGRTDNDPQKPGAVHKLTPGTRILREWNGVTHVIDAVDGGFIWNGCQHRSLSAIARAITGARWSGPRFFGLNDVPPS